MKKVVFILLTLVLVLCLFGCETEASNEREITEANKGISSNVYIWTDEKTGVQYIIYSDISGYAGMGGITPRLNADGTLYGCEKGGE